MYAITGASGHSSGSTHQGSFLKAMRQAFTEARDNAPSFLFIDEIDSFPNRATLKHDWAEYEIQIVNALLTEIDGIGGREGVILLGACNFPEKLDPALLRSGRLDRHIIVAPPDRAALARIFREHLGNDLTDVDLSGAAMAAAGSTGADCEKFVRGARRRARVEQRNLVLDDLMTEISGLPMDPADLWSSAVHEAGHAVGMYMFHPGALESVVLRDAGNSTGFTSGRFSAPLDGSFADGDRYLTVLLSGRAAEEEILGSPSGCAGGNLQSDLALATEFAVRSYSAHGLDPAGGLVWRGEPARHAVADALTSDRVMSDRVQARLDRAYAEARTFIRKNVATVRAVAEALAGKRVLDKSEVEAIMTASGQKGEP